MTADLYDAIAQLTQRRYMVRCMRCEHAQPVQRTCELCGREHSDNDLAALLSPRNGAEWSVPAISDRAREWLAAQFDSLTTEVPDA